ncbi:MAG: hypothetical protein MZV63_23995 [Marinilabiliales bacterium]|nr:hypothetical protein [Marinilabiliales bacterium]
MLVSAGHSMRDLRRGRRRVRRGRALRHAPLQRHAGAGAPRPGPARRAADRRPDDRRDHRRRRPHAPVDHRRWCGGRSARSG